MAEVRNTAFPNITIWESFSRFKVNNSETRNVFVKHYPPNYMSVHTKCRNLREA